MQVKKNLIAGICVLSVLVATIAVLSFWAAFHSPPGPWPESTFYRLCDLHQITNHVQDQQQLSRKWTFSARVSSGKDSGRPQVSFTELTDEFPSKPEGMKEHLKALREQLQKSVADSGAKVSNSDHDVDGFSILYTAGPCKGLIKAVFEKTEPGYQLRIRLEERQP